MILIIFTGNLGKGLNFGGMLIKLDNENAYMRVFFFMNTTRKNLLYFDTLSKAHNFSLLRSIPFLRCGYAEQDLMNAVKMQLMPKDHRPGQ